MRLAKNTNCELFIQNSIILAYHVFSVTKEQLEMFQRNFNEIASQNSKGKIAGLNRKQFSCLLKQCEVTMCDEVTSRIFEVNFLDILKVT